MSRVRNEAEANEAIAESAQRAGAPADSPLPPFRATLAGELHAHSWPVVVFLVIIAAAIIAAVFLRVQPATGEQWRPSPSGAASSASVRPVPLDCPKPARGGVTT